MNTTSPASKNRRRKDRRSQYHQIINALSHNPNDPDALAQLAKLKQLYFRDVDGRLSTLDSEKRERQFTRGIAKQILRPGERNDWVVVTGADGKAVQIKANLNEYVDDRLRRPPSPNESEAQKLTRASGLAAQQLLERAVSIIRPRVARRDKSK